MKLLLILLLIGCDFSSTSEKDTYTTLTEMQTKQIIMLKGQLDACEYLNDNKI